MPLEESPSLEAYKNGLPGDSPGPSGAKQKVRAIIYVLIAIVLVLAAINYLESDKGELLRGKGTVVGFCIDQRGEPITADIFISGLDVKTKADENGKFELRNVPSGMRTVVMAYDYIGVEVDVSIVAGTTLDLGQIRIPGNPRLVLLE